MNRRIDHHSLGALSVPAPPSGAEQTKRCRTCKDRKGLGQFPDTTARTMAGAVSVVNALQAADTSRASSRQRSAQ